MHRLKLWNYFSPSRVFATIIPKHDFETDYLKKKKEFDKKKKDKPKVASNVSFKIL